MQPNLTFDVDGGVGGAHGLSGGAAGRHALEVAGVCVTIHRRELQVTALLKAPLRVLHAPAVLRPPVAHVLRAAELAAQDGTAAVQRVLRLRLLGEMKRRRLDDED